jgi:hypothetical protein
MEKGNEEKRNWEIEKVRKGNRESVRQKVRQGAKDRERESKL